MKGPVYIIGVGMTRFEKQGTRASFDYPDMARESMTKALLDGGVTFADVQQAYVGYCVGDSTCGQRAVYQMGLTGIPIVNVNNNCSTGATAMYLARKAIMYGDAECVMALGFEKMLPGSLTSSYSDRVSPLDKHVTTMAEHREIQPAAITAQFFGNAGLEHMTKYGTKQEQFAKIAVKNHKHSALNPYSQFRKVYTLDEVQASRSVYGPLTLLQCCPVSDGSACALLASESFVKQHQLESHAIRIDAMCMATDDSSVFSGSDLALAGFNMSKRTAKLAYAEASVSAADIQVIELHDCFSTNELITYEALGLCPEGQGGALIESGDVTFGGKWVVNPSGGLISKGHPLGATGIAQCCELTWQLRSWCGERQVPNIRYALQHNIGLGGAAVVGIYSRAFPTAPTAVSKLGYNPAIECRPIGEADFERVAVQASKPASNLGVPGFISSPLVEQLQSILKVMSPERKAALLQQFKGIIQMTLSNKEGTTATWSMVFLEEGMGVYPGTYSAPPNLIFTWTDEGFANMVQGKESSQKAYLQGTLKMKGNMALSTKLERTLKEIFLQSKI